MHSKFRWCWYRYHHHCCNRLVIITCQNMVGKLKFCKSKWHLECAVSQVFQSETRYPSPPLPTSTPNTRVPCTWRACCSRSCGGRCVSVWRASGRSWSRAGSRSGRPRTSARPPGASHTSPCASINKASQRLERFSCFWVISSINYL